MEPIVSRYVFLAVGTTGTLTGVFVDSYGRQVGAVASLAVDSSTAKTFQNVAGGIPSGAVGFVGALTGGALYFGFGAADDGTIGAGQTPAAGYPQLDPATYVLLGRVG